MLTVNFSPFPELKTERVLLRRMQKEDAAALFLLRTNEKVLRYLGKEPQGSVSEAEEMIKQFNNFLVKNESIIWAITFSSAPEFMIGTISLWNIRPEQYRSEIGFVLDPQHWRKGIMKEAVSLVVDYGFNQLRLHSIEALLSPDNAGSVAVLESTGFLKEGHLKENFYFRGEFSDTLIYSQINQNNI
jgi:ribosomal-protein-alanine N-acetyltransferase